jgi:hypothetical protein
MLLLSGLHEVYLSSKSFAQMHLLKSHIRISLNTGSHKSEFPEKVLLPQTGAEFPVQTVLRLSLGSRQNFFLIFTLLKKHQAKEGCATGVVTFDGAFCI